eukprot:1149423-Pelagomonas_calceolata.AAC.1
MEAASHIMRQSQERKAPSSPHSPHKQHFLQACIMALRAKPTYDHYQDMSPRPMHPPQPHKQREHAVAAAQQALPHAPQKLHEDFSMSVLVKSGTTTGFLLTSLLFVLCVVHVSKPLRA